MSTTITNMLKTEAIHNEILMKHAKMHANSLKSTHHLSKRIDDLHDLIRAQNELLQIHKQRLDLLEQNATTVTR